MKLVACPVCHAQYDVSGIDAAHFDCRCGEKLANQAPAAVDAVVARCGSCGAQVGADAAACDYCGSQIVRDLEKLSLLCPECFARNSEDGRFCVACGVAFRPEALPDDSRPELPCPACETPMPASRVAGIPVNECPGCHGLWAPGEHFDALVQRAVRAREERPASADAPRVASGNPFTQELRYRRCPECGEFMLRRNYERSSGIILDRCGEHGSWLDADELEQVAGFILSGGRTSETLEREHESARTQAAAAYARARVETAHPGLGQRRTDPGVGSLLRLFLDILT